MLNEVLVAVGGLVAWGLLSGLLNYALRLRTAEEWVRLGEQRPALAFVIRALRTTGFDPAKLLIAARTYAEARAARAAAAQKPGGPS